MAGKEQKRAFIYYRVSTDMREISSQITLVSRFLKGNPWLKIINRYQDVRSGKDTTGREGFQEMLDRIDCIDYIIISETDRLTRDEAFATKFMYELRDRGIKIAEASTEKIFDFSKRSDRLWFFMLGQEAEDERKRIVLRIKRGIENYKEKNGVWGRKKSWGHKNSGVMMSQEEFVQEYKKNIVNRVSKMSISRIFQMDIQTLYLRLRELKM